MLTCFKLLKKLFTTEGFVSFEEDFIDADFTTLVDIVNDHCIASLFITLYTVVDLYIWKAFFYVICGNVIRANADQILVERSTSLKLGF